MISARDLIRVLRFPLQEVSDWISLARPSQLDYGALAEVSLYLAGGSCEVSHSSIHPSAWKGNSANFAIKEFCELRLNGVLWRSLPEKWLPGIYIAPCATAIVPAVYTRAVGGGRVHHTARKGVEDAKVRDNAGGPTAASEPSHLLLARRVGGGGGARSARSNQGRSCCRRGRSARTGRDLQRSAHRHQRRNQHHFIRPTQRPGAQVLQ